MTRTTACACVPACLGAFDFGLLALAGPRIAAAVGASGDLYPWLFSASSFAYGAVVIPSATLVARRGAPRALSFGLAVAALGTVLLALASTAAGALAARVLFGAGGAVAATAALALLAAIPSEAARRSAFAAFGGAVGVGFAAGALLASLPVWRPTLLVVAAGCAIAAAVCPRLPSTPRRTAGSRSGAVWLAAAVVLAAVALAHAAVVGVVAVGLAVVGLRRAGGWLPPDRRSLARICLAGAATTGSGVSATILVGAALVEAGRPTAVLGVFGLVVLPGAWVARAAARRGGQRVAAGVGLGLQAVGLVAVSASLTAAAPVMAAAVAVFGLGHVAANAGTSGAVATLAGPAAPAVGALLVSAQYVGGGIGPVLTAGHSPSGGVLAAAAIAALGAVVIVPARLGRSVDARSDEGVVAREPAAPPAALRVRRRAGQPE